MDFLSMWSQVTDEQVKRIQQEFFFDCLMGVLTCGLLYLSILYQKGCGIPVREWLIGFFVLYFSRSSFQMIKIAVLTHAYEWRTVYDVCAFTVTNGCMGGWIVYGFVLYYSDKNDCDKVADTSFFSSVMFVILFIGYILIFIYLVMLCTAPCVYMFIRDS